MDFTGKVVIVTGGARGIGRATSQGFATRHAAVAVVDRDEKSGLETAAAIRQAGGKAEFFAADVSVSSQIAKLIPAIVAKYGGIDVLIANAGIQRYGSAVSTAEALWDEVMAVNLKSDFLMSHYTIPEMQKRGGGAIVITGSVQSVGAVVNSVAYVASKHGLLGLGRAMALDHAKDNIRVNVVCPGSTDTPLVRDIAALSDTPQRLLDACASTQAFHRLIRPEEVANVIVFLASDLASYVTGQAVLVDGAMMTACGGISFQDSMSKVTED